MEKNKKEVENKIRRTPSIKLPDGSMAEMVYDPSKNTTVFLKGSKDLASIEQIQAVESIVLDENIMEPLKPTDPLLKLNFARFPVTAYPYDHNKQLFGMVKHYINKYVALPEDFLTVAAVYVMFTWLYDRFSVVPYLRVIGGFGSGKTRFLKIIGNLVYKGMFFGGSATTAVLYRTVDYIRGTMVFDETDFQKSDMSADIIKLLNQGHDKNFPVARMEPTRDGGYRTKVFYVFGPKVFASRERFSDEALESRCVTQRLHYDKDFSRPIVLPDDNEIEATLVRNSLLSFRFLNYHTMDVAQHDLSVIQTARVRQTFMALVSVADLIDKDITDRVIQFGIKVDNELKMQLRNSVEVDVLICLLELLTMNKDQGKIYMRTLAERYHHKYYSEHNDNTIVRRERGERGELLELPNYKISARKIGSIVSKLGIRKDRDGEGICISPTESNKIRSLADYYGITQEMIEDTTSIEI